MHTTCNISLSYSSISLSFHAISLSYVYFHFLCAISIEQRFSVTILNGQFTHLTISISRIKLVLRVVVYLLFS